MSRIIIAKRYIFYIDPETIKNFYNFLETIKHQKGGDKVYIYHPFAVILEIVDSMTRSFLKTTDYILYFFNYTILVIKTVQFKNNMVNNP